MSVLIDFDPEFEYAEECYHYLLKREKQRHQFHNRSPQLQYREELIKRIGILCNLFKLSFRIKYLSIYLMDIFMDNHDINEDVIELMVCSCLVIAAKVDESDNKIPKLNHLVLDPNQYLKSEMFCMETKILVFFDWVFLTPTAATYIDYFYTKCLPKTAINKDSRALVDKYLERSLDKQFHRFYPSIIAASVLYWVRDTLNLSPIWPKSAQTVTQYSVNDMESCVIELRKYEKIMTPLNTFLLPNGHKLRVTTFNDSGIFDCDKC